MKKLLQINPVLRGNTSTGRIMQEIGDLAMANGWESYIAYSKGRDGVRPCHSKLVPVGDRCSVAWHGLMTRLFDRHGLASQRATHRFIRQIKKLNPDIIHIHNIHGYFLNYPLLFDFFRESGIPVVWTVHDCWLYTGHCYYYSFEQCNKWKSQCHHCPQRKKFPTSWFVDRSRQNFEDKRKAFTSLRKGQLTIVPVSEWIRKEMAQSFLKNADFRVIHNGIDLEVFNPLNIENVKEKYKLNAKHIVLGVASIWSPEKGWNDFIELSKLLRSDEQMVLVGVSEKQLKQLPSNIKGIKRTDNVQQLAGLYAAADVFVNPTWQDNYPTVNLEAIACGTPVVTYRTGGSIEAIKEMTGYIVEQGDIASLLSAIRMTELKGKEYYCKACREYAQAHFRKEERYNDYLKLYDELIERR